MKPEDWIYDPLCSCDYCKEWKYDEQNWRGYKIEFIAEDEINLEGEDIEFTPDM